MPYRDKEQQRQAMQQYNHRLRLAALAALGDKCIRCEADDYRVLQIDHVWGGGNKDRGRGKPHAYYKRVVAESGSGKYQLLCANCNWIKKYEENEI